MDRYDKLILMDRYDNRYDKLSFISIFSGTKQGNVYKYKRKSLQLLEKELMDRHELKKATDEDMYSMFL